MSDRQVSRVGAPGPRQSTVAHVRWYLQAVMRILIVDTSRALGTWRWLLVPIVFAIATLLQANQLTYDFVRQRPRAVNIWDAAPAMLTNVNYLLRVFVLGFILLVGDSFLRDREQGMAALMVARAPSRSGWWLAKIASLGALALCYVGIGLVTIVGTSACLVPIALTASPAIQEPLSAVELYPRLSTVPIPIFVLMTGVYTAFTLWIIGSLIVTTSLLFQRLVVPFGIFLTWLILSDLGFGVFQIGYVRLVNLAFFVSYAKHASALDGFPLGTFFLIAGAVLAGTLLLGLWRLRTLDL